MNFQIIHFSDIHFKSSSDSLIYKKSKLFDSLKNRICNNSVILITGDSAFSGSLEEFKISNEFFTELVYDLEKYSKKEIKLIVIPGNHDCQDLIEKDPIRELLLNNIQNNPKQKKEDLIKYIDSVSKNLSNYRAYEDGIVSKSFELVYTSSLLKVYSIHINTKQILFYCFNTAFQSIIREIPGKMVMPISTFDNNILEKKADLKISCFHHPFNWLQPDALREFKELIFNSSDICLTGHEHVSTKSNVSDLEGENIYYFEGDVLQDSDNSENSGFNILEFDFDIKKFKFLNFTWNRDSYMVKNDTDWRNFERGALKAYNPYEFSIGFSKFLDDVGANFQHPNVSKLSLKNIYTYPNLEIMNLPMEEDEHLPIISAKKLINDLSDDIRIIFSGSENIGKTSLIKNIIQSLVLKGKIPIYIEGHRIKSTSISDLYRLISKLFLSIYKSESKEDLHQLDIQKIVVIIDDFDKIRLNTKYKAVFLKNFVSKYPNIILSGNELTSLEDVITDEKIGFDIFSSFTMYQIKEFGYVLRSELINKWNILGIEQKISEEERIQRLNYAESVLNTVVGTNFVPSQPFFIITIMQSIELGNPTDLSASTFGHYYNFLIQKSITAILNSQGEITEYYNYIIQLSYKLFLAENKEIDEFEFQNFDKKYREDYTISHSFEKIKMNLFNAKIIQQIDSAISFKYSYIYFYFISRYLADNLNDKKEIREEIKKLISDLHISENSNILLFMTHHSNNNLLINELLNKTKSLFNDINPIKLEEDIKNINSLVDKIPELVFESRSVDDYREEENKLKDSHENNEIETSKIDEQSDLDEDFGIVNNLNTSFKSLEIIGQILKNNYGKIPNKDIEILIEESILLGLRSLNAFFVVLEESSEYLINQINSIIEELESSRGKKIDNAKKIEDLSKSTLFKLCNQVSYSFIKKISDSIGSKYLEAILEKVYIKNNFNSMKLIKLSIKLDHHKGFPNSEMKKLERHLEGIPLPYQILRRLVINYLYLFPTDYKQKSKILDSLGITMDVQRKIDYTSNIKHK